MQLNMGEGKSSVIVPIVVMALADRSKLVRVVVTKAQSRQMFHDLVSKLGGLINRRVFTMPFSRKLKLSEADAQAIHAQCQKCIDTGGVLLVQPEHVLSLKLMGLEAFISRKEPLARALLKIQSLFDAKSRDIVDESDENFGVKFELIYTVGSQGPIEFGPQRWIIIQEVLGFVKEHVSFVQQKLPRSIEIRSSGGNSGVFPRIRLLKEDAKEMLLEKVVSDICKRGFPGFPISRQPPDYREAVMRYITQPVLSASDIGAVEQGLFWKDSTTKYLLLLRGLFAAGLLAFVFERKRWRVNYGLDSTRQPPTKLAVPYRAKDSPSPRSEFSHPDVVIMLTCNSYYYGGLNDEDMSQAFEHLLDSEQADAEYQAWVQDAHNLPSSFNSLMGINLTDSSQCKRDVFPSCKFQSAPDWLPTEDITLPLSPSRCQPYTDINPMIVRYAKRTIDYFLQSIVFPKQMRQFPKKLSASGWDLGDVKSHPTTGFSGTIDSSRLLPLDVKYLDLPSQRHTDALVLDNLLRPENEVVLLPAGPVTNSDDADDDQTSTSDVKALLNVLLSRREPNLRVIIDVGAYILDLTNVQVAREWLQMAQEHDKEVQAAIYFNEEEELMVIDAKGNIEQLRTSPYTDQLDVCIVFLDEAHTRGTDLRLPEYYRAAVTLGANLTKDRLVQGKLSFHPTAANVSTMLTLTIACMRMRKLGKGQSLIFCVPPEIQTKIQEAEVEGQIVSLSNNWRHHQHHIGVLDVLKWAISETHMDLWRSISLWAAQGRRFDRQKAIWREAISGDKTIMTAPQAVKFLEDESISLEERYRPRVGAIESDKEHENNEREQQISQRCEEVGSLQFDQAALQEEQERELAPEIEEERQTERPPPANAAEHAVHPDLECFVATGELPAASSAFIPAFQTLRETAAAKHLDVDEFPKDILVTRDFAATVAEMTKTHFNSDAYQRPVHWILTSQPNSWDAVVIISPFEAEELLPDIQRYRKTTLHVYSARPSLEIKSLDDLTLYTVPSRSPNQAREALPLHLAVQLNLFAGQLFFKSFEEYVELCNMLRICWKEAEKGDTVDADGFIREARSEAGMTAIEGSTFRKSPVDFLRAFLSKSRRDCQSIGKTQLGRVLDGIFLQRKEFEPEQEDADVEMRDAQEIEDGDKDGDGDVEMGV